MHHGSNNERNPVKPHPINFFFNFIPKKLKSSQKCVSHFVLFVPFSSGCRWERDKRIVVLFQFYNYPHESYSIEKCHWHHFIKRPSTELYVQPESGGYGYNVNVTTWLSVHHAIFRPVLCTSHIKFWISSPAFVRTYWHLRKNCRSPVSRLKKLKISTKMFVLVDACSQTEVDFVALA